MGLVGTLGGEGHGLVEFFRRLLTGAGTDEFGQVELQDDVHTALQVKTEIEFLLLDVLVRVIEINLFVCDRIEVLLVGSRAHGVEIERAVELGNLCKRRTLLHLFHNLAGSLGGLFLLNRGRSRERQLEHTGKADENGHECDGTFALHKELFLIKLSYSLLLESSLQNYTFFSI